MKTFKDKYVCEFQEEDEKQKWEQQGGIQEGPHTVTLPSDESEEPLSPPSGSESNCTNTISLLQPEGPCVSNSAAVLLCKTIYFRGGIESGSID